MIIRDPDDEWVTGNPKESYIIIPAVIAATFIIGSIIGAIFN